MTTAPSFTDDDCRRIAELLGKDEKMTLVSACIDAGCGEQYRAILEACKRVRRNTKVSEAMIVRVFPIIRAIDRQCDKLLEKAENLADSGKSAALYTWWLEKKNRTEYGNITRTEHTGEDGEAIKVNTMAEKSDAELLDLLLKAKGAAGGGE